MSTVDIYWDFSRGIPIKATWHSPWQTGFPLCHQTVLLAIPWVAGLYTVVLPCPTQILRSIETWIRSGSKKKRCSDAALSIKTGSKYLSVIRFQIAYYFMAIPKIRKCKDKKRKKVRDNNSNHFTKHLIQAKNFPQTITLNLHNSPNNIGTIIPFHRQKAYTKTSYINCPRSHT